MALEIRKLLIKFGSSQFLCHFFPLLLVGRVLGVGWRYLVILDARPPSNQGVPSSWGTCPTSFPNNTYRGTAFRIICTGGRGCKIPSLGHMPLQLAGSPHNTISLLPDPFGADALTRGEDGYRTPPGPQNWSETGQKPPIAPDHGQFRLPPH